MNRRDAMNGILEGALHTEDLPSMDSSEQLFANKVLPTVHHTGGGLEPYSGIWGTDQILHLLRRTTFGVVPADVQTLETMSMEQGINTILTIQAENSMPLTTDSREELAPVGETWVYALYKKADSTFTPTSIRTTSLKSLPVCVFSLTDC